MIIAAALAQTATPTTSPSPTQTPNAAPPVAAVQVAPGTPGYAMGAIAVPAPFFPGSSTFSVSSDELGRTYYVNPNPNPVHGMNGIYITNGSSSILSLPNSAGNYGAGPSAAQGGSLFFAAVTPFSTTFSCIFRAGPISNINDAITSLLAGSCGAQGIVDGVGPTARFQSIKSLSASTDGTLYVIDDSRVRRVSPQGVTSTMTASGQLDFGTFSSSSSGSDFFNFVYPPHGMVLSPAGALYVIILGYYSDPYLFIFAPGLPLQSFVSRGCADGALATSSFSDPRAIASDTSGTIYIADDCLLNGHATLRILSAGVVVTAPLPGVPTNATTNPYQSQIRYLSAGGSTVRFSTLSYSLSSLISDTQFFPALFFILGQTLVSPGLYSTGSLWPVACPAGRYGATAGLSSSSCTGICPAGSRCINGTIIPAQCSAGTWSAAGSATCSPCDAGRYGATSGLTSSQCTAACPAGSGCPSGTSSPTICPTGTWSAAGSTCLPCNNGTYGNTTGLTSPSCSGSCAFAPLGYVCSNLVQVDSLRVVLVPSGAVQPRLCPQGHYCPDFATVLPCASGSYACLAGVDDCAWPVNISQFRIPRTAATSYAQLSDAFGNPISFLIDGSGMYPTQGWTSRESGFLVQGFSQPACSGLVSPGYNAAPYKKYYSSDGWHYYFRAPVSRTGGYVERSETGRVYVPSSPCPLGSFCPGASPALPCRPGTYNPVTGRTTCLLCASGTFQPLTGQSFCDGFCPLGTFSVRAGAVNSSTCSPCPAGTYGLGEGSSACTPCPSGSYSTALGAISSTTCTPCPAGTSTLNDGSYSPKACITGLAFVCPVGQQPSSPATPTSAADCAPLTCAPPLLLLPDSSGCSGCSAGTYGVPGACKACPSGFLCPGLLSLPLYNFSSTLAIGARAAAAAAPARSTAAAPAPVGCPFLQPLSSPADSPASSSATLGSTTAAIAGGSVVGVLLLGTLLATLHSRLLFFKLPKSFKPYLLLLDLMSPGRPVTIGAEHYLAEREKNTLGASATLLAIGALGVLAAVLATQRAESNTLSQQSLGVLREGASKAAPLPWAKASAAAAAAALPVPSSGVFLRFTASGEPGQCQPSALTTVGLSEGAWALLPSPTCIGAFSQFTLACPTCMFSPTSAVSFLLPYSCQSLLVEAGAVDADGSLAVLSLPPGATSAPGSGGVLHSGVTWALAPLLSQLNNTISPGQSRKGWQLLSQGFTSAPPQQLSPSNGANGSLTVLPLSSSIAVRVTLELQPYVSTTTLTELTTVLQLLSSIVGFQGVIFSAVGLLFGLLTSTHKAAEPSKQAPDTGDCEKGPAGVASEKALHIRGPSDASADAASEKPVKNIYAE